MGAGIGSVEVVGIGTGEGVGVEIKLDKSDAVGGKQGEGKLELDKSEVEAD